MTDEQFKEHMAAMKDMCEKMDSINYFLAEADSHRRQNAGYSIPVEIMRDNSKRG